MADSRDQNLEGFKEYLVNLFLERMDAKDLTPAERVEKFNEAARTEGVESFDLQEALIATTFHHFSQTSSYVGM